MLGFFSSPSMKINECTLMWHNKAMCFLTHYLEKAANGSLNSRS